MYSEYFVSSNFPNKCVKISTYNNFKYQFLYHIKSFRNRKHNKSVSINSKTMPTGSFN